MDNSGRRTFFIFIALAIIVAVVVAALSMSSAKAKGNNEIMLEGANNPGPAPFSAAPTAQVPQGAQLPTPPVPAASTKGTNTVSGTTPGLYGGVQGETTCNARQIIAGLDAKPDLAAAWAKPLNINPANARKYIEGLTPVVLRVDTRLTDWELRGNKAVPAQKVFQGGTSVLIDREGLPRVKCGSGDPLTEPQAVPAGSDGFPRYRGTPWPGFSPGTVVIVRPTQPVDNFVLIDLVNGRIIIRTPGLTVEIDFPVGTLGPVLRPGDPVTVAAANFPPGTLVTVTLDNPAVTLGTFTTDGGGNLNATVIIPLGTPGGFHTITATAPGAPPQQLPFYLLPNRL